MEARDEVPGDGDPGGSVPRDAVPARDSTSGGSGGSSASLPLIGRPLVNPRLAADPRARVWITRIVIAAAVYLGFMLGLGWRYAVSATAIYVIGDVVYRSKTTNVIPASVRVTSAQRSTERRLRMLRAAGYYALNACQIPGTQTIIDHVVVGPAGVFSVDSERLDRRLTIRLKGGKFFHGPASQIDRITHASEEAAQAATMIGTELGKPVRVQPVMIIYGPEVPWKVMRFEGVDIFDGGRIGTYFRRKSKETAGYHLTPADIDQILEAAAQALPPLDGG